MVGVGAIIECIINSQFFWCITSIVGSHVFSWLMSKIGKYRVHRKEQALKRKAELVDKIAERMADEAVNAAGMLHSNPGRYYTCRLIDVINYNHYKTNAVLWFAGFIAFLIITNDFFAIVPRLCFAYFFGSQVTHYLRLASRIRLNLQVLPGIIDIVDGVYKNRGKNEGDGEDEQIVHDPGKS